MTFSFRLILPCALACTFLTTAAFGQRELYPVQQGKDQVFHLDLLPNWLQFSGELRNRLEDQTALNLRPGFGRFYTLTRARGTVDIIPAKWLVLQLQFQDTHALGLPLRDVAANQRDQFDFFQTFADFKYRKSNLFIGRQILRFGDERVIGPSDWTNNSRTWDGVDLRLGTDNRVDIWTISVVQVTPTSLDKHGAGLTFHGVVGQFTIGPHENPASGAKQSSSGQGHLPSNILLDPFLLVRTNPRVRSLADNQFGSEAEFTFGTYFQTILPYGFQASGTGDLQRGSYSTDSIHAGAAIIRGGWVARHAPWQPHIEGEYDYATGNPRRNLGRVSTYDQQYPSNHNAFGLVDLFGFQNIKQDRLNISATPLTTETSNLQALFQVGSLHLATARDAVYASAGAVFQAAPAQGFRGDGIGTEFDASAKYIWRQTYVANIGVGHLFNGASLTSTGRGAPITLAYFQLTYRFRAVGKGEHPPAGVR